MHSSLQSPPGDHCSGSLLRADPPGQTRHLQMRKPGLQAGGPSKASVTSELVVLLSSGPGQSPCLSPSPGTLRARGFMCFFLGVVVRAVTLSRKPPFVGPELKCQWNACICLFPPRPTLYVGKYSTSLYASPSMVHEGVAVVVSPLWGLGGGAHGGNLEALLFHFSKEQLSYIQTSC